MKVKVFALVICVVLTLPALAHRYFFGLTEISSNQNTGAVEFVHQYTLHDVQHALSKLTGERFSLDQENAEAVLQQWVTDNFSVKNTKGEEASLKWVGFEADYQKIWVYQELPKQKSLCGWEVSNTLLFDSFSAQVNTVNVVDSYGNRSLILTDENRTDTINCQKDSKE